MIAHQSKGDGCRHSVLAAVCDPACSLPSHLRLFLIALAQLADWRTGRGLAGQARLAAAMGVSVRAVQRYRIELAARSDSPVTVEWQARGDSVGRTSDIYRLQWQETRQSVAFPGGKPDTLSGKSDKLAGNPMQGSASAESSADGYYKKVPSGSGSPAEAGPAPGRGGARRTHLDPEWRPPARLVELADQLGRGLAEAVESFRLNAAASGRLAASWDSAFELWLLRGRKPRLEAARRQEWAASRERRKAAALRNSFAAAIGELGAKPLAALRLKLKDRRLMSRARRILGVERGVALKQEQLQQLIEICRQQRNSSAP